MNSNNNDCGEPNIIDLPNEARAHNPITILALIGLILELLIINNGASLASYHFRSNFINGENQRIFRVQLCNGIIGSPNIKTLYFGT